MCADFHGRFDERPLVKWPKFNALHEPVSQSSHLSSSRRIKQVVAASCDDNADAARCICCSIVSSGECNGRSEQEKRGASL